MKAPLLLRLVVVVAVASGIAFFLTRLTHTPSARDELEWLSDEFSLTPEQTERVAALHAAYAPICAEHCAAIVRSRHDIQMADTAASRRAAQDRAATLHQSCLESTQAHLAAVAAVMEPSAGRRYLEMIGPRLRAHQHAQPFGLR